MVFANIPKHANMKRIRSIFALKGKTSCEYCAPYLQPMPKSQLSWFAVESRLVPCPSFLYQPQRPSQEFKKRCRLSWLTNSALAYDPKCGGRVGVAGSQPMSRAVHRSPNKLWRSNLWSHERSKGLQW
jgi:hypothetical protein